MDGAQRIATCLMFVGQQYGHAEEAMNLYVSTFDDSHVVAAERFAAEEGQSGIKRARFTLAGRDFVVMDSGGPHEFTFTPAVSMFVDCATEAELDTAFARLAEGGEILMPLGPYPFSARFGWLADRYGVSWQLNLPGPD